MRVYDGFKVLAFKVVLTSFCRSCWRFKIGFALIFYSGFKTGRFHFQPALQPKLMGTLPVTPQHASVEAAGNLYPLDVHETRNGWSSPGSWGGWPFKIQGKSLTKSLVCKLTTPKQ